MRLIVVYDISDDDNRLRVARRLKSLGLRRIQRSAFIGRGGAALAKDVVRAVARYVRGPSDSLIVFIVPNEAVRRALVVGARVGLETAKPYTAL